MAVAWLPPFLIMKSIARSLLQNREGLDAPEILITGTKRPTNKYNEADFVPLDFVPLKYYRGTEIFYKQQISNINRYVIKE